MTKCPLVWGREGRQNEHWLRATAWSVAESRMEGTWVSVLSWNRKPIRKYCIGLSAVKIWGLLQDMVLPNQTHCFDLLCKLDFCVRFLLNKGFHSKRIKWTKPLETLEPAQSLPFTDEDLGAKHWLVHSHTASELQRQAQDSGLQRLCPVP